MSDQITYSIDGLDSDGGHVQLAEFLDRLGHVLTVLNGIDRLVGDSGTPKLYYRIVQASHNSPLRFALEPVVKKGMKVAPDYVQQCRRRFFGEMGAIRSMKPISADIDLDLLDQIRDIAFGVGQDFKRAEISNGEYRVEINDEFEKNIKQITGEGDISYGSLEGMLDAANIHGVARRFWIYPKIGPQKVRCDFLPGTKDQIKAAMGHCVRVTGLKFFRTANPHPFRIKVKDFNVVSSESAVSVNDLGGMAPNATGEMSAVEFIRAIRDEWD